MVSNQSKHVGGMESHRGTAESQQSADDDHEESLEFQATLEFFFRLC